jgi:release factor glutamine methyltransferase
MKFTIESIMKQSTKFLRVYGFERPRHESVIIIKNILKKSYEDIVISKDVKISLQARNKILENLFQRLKGKPLSKISGLKEFYSRQFITSEETLDPRPETELIVDVVKDLLKGYKKNKISILDVGTGSACIIITITLELISRINIQATGLDISRNALRIARKNLIKFNLNKRINLIKSNWFESLHNKFDFVISNPPYIKINDLNNLGKELHFDPLISLEAGLTGLRSYFEIAKGVHKHIKKDGFIILEIGKGQLKEVDKIFSNQGFRRILKEKDLQGIDRVVVYQYKSTKNIE